MKKYYTYTIEWMVDDNEKVYSDHKRFESGEEEQMNQFLLTLMNNENVYKIWKNTCEEISL